LAQQQLKTILSRIARHDDEKALKELFDLFYGKLIEVSKFYVNDHFSAQDVVSVVFIKLWNSRADLEKIQNINSYLFVMTKRQSLNYIRDNKKRDFYPLEEWDTQGFVELRSPEKQLLSKEFIEILNTAIQDLPSKCRLVYSLVKDEGMKYQEVAELLDISIKTVEMHVGKALKRIKIAFDDYQK